MGLKRMKAMIVPLILSSYCLHVIDSFGGPLLWTSVVNHHSTGRRHNHDRRRGQSCIVKSDINVPLFSSAQNQVEWKQKETQRNSNHRSRKHYPTNDQRNFSKNGQKGSNPFIILNRKIADQDNAQDVLGILAATKGALSSVAGGGAMSTVNFSTSIHRIARHLTLYTSKDQPGNNRAKILTDPRFALLVCSIAEASLDGAQKEDNEKSRKHELISRTGRKLFGSREIANIAWAIAKLNIVPPDSVVPVDAENVETLLREKSEVVRSEIFKVAKERATPGSSSSSSSWIPALSALSGLLIDFLALKALELDPRGFQQQEFSNLIWSLATVQRKNQEVFEFVINGMIAIAEQRNRENNDSYNTRGKGGNVIMPQEWSIPLWVLAKTGTDLGHEEDLLPFVEGMMDNIPGFLERFKPQELSNSVWAAASIISKRPQKAKGAACDAALGILRHTSREMVRRQGERYKTQELANHAWAMATLGFGVAVSPGAQAAQNCELTHSYTYLLSDDPKGDKALMEETIKVIYQKMEQNLRRFTTQELNNMCWAMARLDQKDERLLEMIGRELTNPRRQIKSQDISTALWSMATMEYFDKGLYRSIIARSFKIGVERFKPQEISNTLWALAKADVIPKYKSAFDVDLLPSKIRPSIEEVTGDPITAFFGAGADVFSLRPNDFKTQEIKDILWAFVKVGLRHPKLFKSVAEHLVGKGDHPDVTGRGLNEFNTQGIANLAYAYAKHAQLGADTMEKYKFYCQIPFTSGKLAHYTIIYYDIGEGLIRKLFVEISRAAMEVHDNFSNCPAQDVSNTIWAMALLGMRHQSFLEAVEAVLQQRMQGYLAGSKSPRNFISGQEIGNTVWAFAMLDYKPRSMFGLMEAYWMKVLNGDMTASNISRFFGRQELANIAWATAVFGLGYPKNVIEVLYNGLLGLSEGLDADYMQSTLYKDEGLESSHFNSILYLQIMMDLEIGVAQNSFSLPENFPSAWTKSKAFPTQSQISKSSSPPTAIDHDGNDSIDNGIMEINTSGIQKRISNAFDRIEFGHVDEHCLTMKDLADEFGIQIPSLPVEILSLDIANIDLKTAVEVDGPGHWVTNIDPSDNHDIVSNTGYYRSAVSKKGEKFHEYVFKWNHSDQVMNGSTSLKQRLFNLIGWRIISMAFWEWYPVDNPKAKKEVKFEAQNNFCRSLLENKI